MYSVSHITMCFARHFIFPEQKGGEISRFSHHLQLPHFAFRFRGTFLFCARIVSNSLLKQLIPLNLGQENKRKWLYHPFVIFLILI